MYTEDQTIIKLAKQYAPEGFNKRQVQVTPDRRGSLTTKGKNAAPKHLN